MNRIILIGNGFDLAHGLETSYKNFIDNYWLKTFSSIQKANLFHHFENGELEIPSVSMLMKKINSFEDFKNFLTKNYPGEKIIIRNKFLMHLSRKRNLKNWVDIENEYYLLLMKAINNNSIPDDVPYPIDDLNSDFNAIKKMLAEYLIIEESNLNKRITQNFPTIQKTIGRHIYEPIQINDISEVKFHELAENEKKQIESNLNNPNLNPWGANLKEKLIYESLKDPIDLGELKNLMRSEKEIKKFESEPQSIIFLNFNYTSTHKIYTSPKQYQSSLSNDKVDHIQIHGSLLKHENNPMIFGFGDEIDEKYKSIESLNDNRYLEHIKSINYLESENYKKLLSYINSDNFQVFVFGHSCGISDRTLLNTIFEHDNCASIKVFYKNREDESDNFSDIVRNISRNFSDKPKMRDRVVNKNFSEPLT